MCLQYRSWLFGHNLKRSKSPSHFQVIQKNAISDECKTVKSCLRVKQIVWKSLVGWKFHHGTLKHKIQFFIVSLTSNLSNPSRHPDFLLKIFFSDNIDFYVMVLNPLNKCWFLWHVVTTVSPLLYGLWLSLILFWFSVDFYDVLFGGRHFHSARAPLPFCFIAFLASHRRVGLENNQNIGKAIFYTINKTIFYRYRSQTNIQD